MPGKTISERFDPPTLESFATFAHIYTEYLHIRLGDLILSCDVILKLLERAAKAGQPATLLLETMKQASIDLKGSAQLAFEALRQFYFHFQSEVDSYSPYDAAAWDRLYAASVEVVAPYVPKLEELAQNLETCLNNVFINHVVDNAGEHPLSKARDLPEENRKALRVLRHQLTAEGLEAYHAGLLRGERLDFS